MIGAVHGPVRRCFPFAALAGVRAAAGFTPLIPPRGIPTDVSQEVADRYFMPVMESVTASSCHVGGHFTPAEAAALIEARKSSTNLKLNLTRWV
jgi:hypothetical protein